MELMIGIQLKRLIPVSKSQVWKRVLRIKLSEAERQQSYGQDGDKASDVLMVSLHTIFRHSV